MQLHPNAKLTPKTRRLLVDRVIRRRWSVRRLGGKTDLPIDVTVIATTNTNLEEAAAAEKFRADLLYRLNTFPLHIPPLRERREDIPLLARHFLKVFSQTYLKKAIKKFSPEAEKILCAHEWKGNCRELKNVVERIVVLENIETILPQHLPAALTKGKFAEHRHSGAFVLPKEGISLEQLEKDLIKQALERANNDQTKAAKLLGISYDSLRYQIKKFGIN